MEGEMKEEALPPGFRFHPTDEELITFYLINKISDSSFTGKAIGDVDLNKSEPWDLPGKAKMGEKEWYFFSLRDRKYPTGVRTNRATNTGYWKTTGKDKEIYSSVTSELVGMKKTLVFYKGRAPRGEKTNWVMHEYRIHAKSSYRTAKDEWVVCRVFQKSVGKKFPSNQSRAAINHYNNLDIGSSTAVNVSSQMMMQVDAFQYNMGRNYISPAEMQELSRVFRSPSSNMNLQLQSQMNYNATAGGGTGFTFSGLNLNLSGSTTAPANLRSAVPPPIISQEDVPELTNGLINPHDAAGYVTAEMSNSTSMGSRFVLMDHCDMENYWPSY